MTNRPGRRSAGLAGITSIGRQQATPASSRLVTLELRFVQAGVWAVGQEQLRMGTTLDDAALLHHQDQVGLLDRA